MVITNILLSLILLGQFVNFMESENISHYLKLIEIDTNSMRSNLNAIRCNLLLWQNKVK